MIPQATIVTWLDKHQGFAIVVLTAALIAVTIYYAWQTGRTVGEMRRARQIAVLPKLAIEFHFIGPMNAALAIRNVGPGPALGVDVKLIYETVDSDQDPPERRWRRNVMASGEQFEFFPPGGANASSIDALSATYKAVRLVGTMEDATGSHHKVEESLGDLADWRQVLEEAQVRWTASDPERRLADEMGKKLDNSVRTVTASIDRIGAALTGTDSWSFRRGLARRPLSRQRVGWFGRLVRRDRAG